MCEVFGLDDLSHFLGCGEAVVIDADDGDDARDVLDKDFVLAVEILEELQAYSGFASSASHFDAFEGAFGFDIEIDDDIGFAHEIAHVSEQLYVSFIISWVHEAGFGEHGSEDGIFVDGAVLNGGFPSPDDFLMLLKAPCEEVNLHGEGVPFHVGVVVFEIFVIFDGFVIGFDAEVFGEGGGEGGFSGADHACDTDKEIFHGD